MRLTQYYHRERGRLLWRNFSSAALYSAMGEENLPLPQACYLLPCLPLWRRTK